MMIVVPSSERPTVHDSIDSLRRTVLHLENERSLCHNPRQIRKLTELIEFGYEALDDNLRMLREPDSCEVYENEI